MCSFFDVGIHNEEGKRFGNGILLVYTVNVYVSAAVVGKEGYENLLVAAAADVNVSLNVSVGEEADVCIGELSIYVYILSALEGNSLTRFCILYLKTVYPPVLSTSVSIASGYGFS